jgi:hypothetical protein
VLQRRAVRRATIALSLSLLLGVGLGLGKPFLLPRDLPGRSGVDVLTQHNDTGRTGATLHETLLNTTDVNVKTFGKLFTRPVDGQIYAQPLYVSALHIPHKGTHNVVFVATMHDSVYAFDADDPAASTALWQVTLGASIPVTNADFGGRYGPYRDITVEIGILSTPAIDRATDTIYVLAANRDSDGRYVHRLHALDLGTGAEKFGGPVETQGSVPGRGAGSIDGIVTFDNKQQVQRAGLLLANGLVYVAFGGYADTDPYHGWIFAYDAHSLQRRAIFNDTPNGAEGGIWQAGWGPAADASGHVYVATGNGDWDASRREANYGDSYLKLSPTLAVDDWFTPWNQADLLDDQDLGSTGLMLIPGPHLLVSGDKQGWLYLLRQDAMGHYNRHGDTQIVQRFQATKGPMHGGTVFWDGPSGAQVYVWSSNDGLKAFRLSGGIFQTTPASQSTLTIPPNGFPGGMLALSANGRAAGSGIVWALCPYSGDASTGTASGILRAFDASDVSKELWNSRQDASRDDVGTFAKFNTPTIANGKVYVPTFSGYLAVYGLLPPTRR